MPTPRMNPKRWFWTLMAAALLWSFFGTRLQASSADRTIMLRIQTWISTPVTLLMGPPQWVFGTIESVAAAGISRVMHTQSDAPTAQEYETQIRNLQSALAQAQLQREQALSKLSAYENLKNIQIGPHDVLSANCLANESGPGSRIIHLDQGSMHGVQMNMAVFDARRSQDNSPEPVVLLGRIVSVGTLDSYAQLLTDSHSSCFVQIIHNDSPITREPHLAKGLSTDMMKCDTIDKQSVSAAPEPGDLVLLDDSDNAWQSAVHGMTVGQVAEVLDKDNQPLRYDIRITPRVYPAQIQYVMILLK